MAKKRNVIFTILQREYFMRCNIRANMKILRELICQKSSKLEKIWEKHSNQPIHYEMGRLYFNNYRDCYTICGINRLPQKIYSLPPVNKSQKIEDGIICQFPLERIPQEVFGYCGSFLALTAHNYLIRYAIDSGTKLQDVYLSSKYKFRHLSWDIDGCTVAVRSTHSKMSTLHRQAGLIQTLLMAIAVFKVFPLQFDGMLEITKQVFGRDITDAMVAQGAVIIMHQGGTVKIYSWDQVKKMGHSEDLSLHQRAAAGVVGEPPYGIPCNIHLKESPPVLFQVKCADHNLILGGVPWHYIITPVGCRGCFQVYSLADGCMAENGQLDMDSLGVEPDRCHFHSDDSGRIIHLGGNELRVLKLNEKSDGHHSVSIEFNITSSDLRENTTRFMDHIGITSSGRTVKKSQSYDDEVECEYQVIQSVDYENDLDLLSLTVVNPCDGGMHGEVCLCDNNTGQIIKRLQLTEPWREFSDHTVQVDLDTVVHIVKAPSRKFTCYVHRMKEDFPDVTKRKERLPKKRKIVLKDRIEFSSARPGVSEKNT